MLKRLLRSMKNQFWKNS